MICGGGLARRLARHARLYMTMLRHTAGKTEHCTRAERGTRNVVTNNDYVLYFYIHLYVDRENSNFNI